MRILLVSKMVSASGGGQDRQVYLMAKKLAERNHYVEILSSDYNYDGIINVYTTLLPVKWRIMYYVVTKNTEKWLDNNIGKFDLVHAHGHCCHLVDTVAKIAKKSDKPFVWTIHSLTPSSNILYKIIMWAYQKKINNKTIKYSDKIIAVSETIKKQLIRLKVFEEKIEVIYPIVEPLPILPKTKAKADHDKKTFLFIGRLSREKGIEFLIKSALKSSYHNKKFLIVGGGSQRYLQKLKRMSEGLDTEFTGQVSHDRLPNIFAKSDVYVQSSRYESFGLALVEALQAGLPIISTKTGIANEILGKDQLVDYGDTKRMAYVMDTIPITTKALANPIGGSIGSIEKIYKDILSTTPPPNGRGLK